MDLAEAKPNSISKGLVRRILKCDESYRQKAYRVSGDALALLGDVATHFVSLTAQSCEKLDEDGHGARSVLTSSKLRQLISSFEEYQFASTSLEYIAPSDGIESEEARLRSRRRVRASIRTAETASSEPIETGSEAGDLSMVDGVETPDKEDGFHQGLDFSQDVDEPEVDPESDPESVVDESMSGN